MDEMERVFRWAWYHDFGTTPEQSLERLKGRVIPGYGRDCDLSTSHFEMSIEQLLTNFSRDIINQGQANNIDARAIAGAITWEYEENLRGRISDYFQSNKYGKGQMLFGQGMGWGSIHTAEVKKIRPNASDWRLQCLRMEAASAIKLVAEIMNTRANQYYEASGGIWIRNAPAVLAMFFNASEEFLLRSAANRKLDACEPGKVVTLTVSENPMATWVQNNLDRFSAFLTTPSPPAGFYATVQTQ